MKSYPPLRLAVLSGLADLKEELLADPEFLDKPDLPYDGQTLVVLKKILAPQTVTKIVEKSVAAKGERGRPSKEPVLSEENQEKVRKELDRLIEGLNNMSDGEGLDTNSRIQITKLKANVIDQLLKMQERAYNVKRMSQFQEIIMGILDDLIDEKGRETFLHRIEPYR